MGALKTRLIEEKEKELEKDNMLDADNRNEEWLAGIIEVEFKRSYYYSKTEMYNYKKKYELMVDAIERKAWTDLEKDLSSGIIISNDDNFEFNIIKD